MAVMPEADMSQGDTSTTDTSTTVTSTTGMSTTGMAVALERLLPAGRVVRDPDVMASYAHDEAEWAPHGTPVAVVRPRETAEVREVVALCAERGVPVVARGAGTGLSGGANAVEGCVLISFEAMNAIVSID